MGIWDKLKGTQNTSFLIGNQNKGTFSGTVDPTVGAGVPALEGSIYLQFVSGAGAEWLKTGVADTAWNRISTSRTIGFNTDGTVGSPRYIKFPHRALITSVFLIADVSGNIVIDIWKVASGSIPTVANTITASAKPTLSSAQTYTDSTLTGWTPQVSANDVFGFNVVSSSVISWAGLQLFLRPN